MTDNYEQAAEQFMQEVGREHYENGAGLKDSLDIVPIYFRYLWLFDRPSVDKFLQRQDREGRHLAAFACAGYASAQVNAMTEEITNSVTRAVIEWRGEEVPYRRASVILANEADAGKRHELENLIHAKTEEQNPLRAERLRMLHGVAGELGFAGYIEMCDDLQGINMPWLIEKTGELLRRTEKTYAHELGYFLDKIGVDQEDAAASDLSYLFRSPEFDNLFPQEQLVPSLTRTMAGLGIDLNSQKNVHLDTEPRPLKSPRAFCVPLRIPDEVYLVISPRGGQDDYRAILHESGHAEHFAHISPDLPFAFKRLGDGAISESYSFLFDNLMKNPLWLSDVLHIDDVDEYLRMSRFHKLWILRRYSAKLHYESELHRADNIESMRSRYSNMLGSALGVRISQSNYLADVDDGLYAANYLRAWIFEVMMREYLEKTCGERWYSTIEAGEFLKSLWRQGQSRPTDEICRDFGFDGLDAEPLIAELAVG